MNMNLSDPQEYSEKFVVSNPRAYMKKAFTFQLEESINYSVPNHKDLTGYRLFYKEEKLENSFHEYQKFYSWFEKSMWKNHLSNTYQGIDYIDNKSWMPALSIYFIDTSKEELYNNLYNLTVKLKEFKSPRLFYTVTSGTFFQYHKQKGMFYNISIGKHSILHEVISNLFKNDSTKLQAIRKNQGVNVEDFIQILESYESYLKQLLLNKNIEPSSQNVYNLHLLSLRSSTDSSLQKAENEINNKSLLTKKDKWLELISQEIDPNLIVFIASSQVLTDFSEKQEIINLWNTLPFDWFLRTFGLNQQ